MSAKSLIVIGGGISGLLASCFAARAGHKVKLLKYGQGALSVAGGIIDLFGYDDKGQLIKNPLEHIKTLKKPHPYALIGADNVEKAVNEFLDFTRQNGFEYLGSADKNQMVPTAIGTFKPSCLTPHTIDASLFEKYSKICVVGFNMLKDFFPNIATENLNKIYKGSKEISSINITLPFEASNKYRDVSALDIARLLEEPAGYLNVIEQLKKKASPNTLFVLPPVLGEKPDFALYERLTHELNCGFIEVSSIPPSVTGYRLDSLLINCAKRLGVEIIEKALVKGSTIDKDVCKCVCTDGFDRDREYYADEFILATGGVFGNGLIAQMGAMYDPIFQLSIDVPENQQDWSHQYLFTGKPQPFATYGIKTDESLRPIDVKGDVLIKNVRVIGRSLANYDFCFEKSGNGVAIASAYHAVSQL